MKKIVLICLSFFVLIGCSTNDNQKLSGKAVNAKLEKNGLKLADNDNDGGLGYISFYLTKKDYPVHPFQMIIHYSDDEATGFRIDESFDEVADRYIYDIDNDYSYVYLVEDDCYYAIDGETPKNKVGVCSGKEIKKAKNVYNEFEKNIFKEIGITKDDLITFGNWYNKNNHD